MKKFIVATLLIIALPLMMAAECNKDLGDPRQTEYNKEIAKNPPDPKQPAEMGTTRTVVITANVEDRYAPYRVTGLATDTVTGAETTLNEPVAGGPFTKILPYESGHRVVITIRVSAAQAGSPNGYLIIKDGPANKEVKKFGGLQTIQIEGFRTVR